MATSFESFERKIAEAKRRFGVKARIDPDEQIRVCRQPAGFGNFYPDPFDFDFADLRNFRISAVSGGVQQRHQPLLYANTWCWDEPVPGFHSCAHGPGPHNIMVCITKSHNRKIYSRLLTWVPENILGARGPGRRYQLVSRRRLHLPLETP